MLQVLSGNFGGNREGDEDSPENIYELLFYGKYKYLHVEDQNIINKNRDVIYALSSHISWINCKFVQDTITA